MMRRRDLIVGVVAAASTPAAWTPMVRAQPAPGPMVQAQPAEGMRRVGILVFSAENDPVAETRLAAFRDGLHKLGWTEGVNLQIDTRFGAADPVRLRTYAQELVNLAPDVIVTGAAPATRAVQQLAIGARWLELLREAAPHVSRVALLHSPEFDSRSYLAAIETAAQAYHVKAVRMPARGADEIEHAIGKFAAEPNGALVVVPPTPTFDNVTLIFRLTTKHRLPAIYPTRGFAEEGGLMAFGPSSGELFHDSASYVDRILRGANPADLMVGFPTKFDLVINLKAAKAIGLTIPRSLLVRAAEVIK
jgi:putative ABC transport system substrate-binding protein